MLVHQCASCLGRPTPHKDVPIVRVDSGPRSKDKQWLDCKVINFMSSMNKIKYCAVVALLLAGCASFKTKQVDERVLPDGSHTAITTYATSRTLFTSKSDLANFKASQTEGSQSATVGSLGQASSGTNAVEALRSLDSILSKIR